MRKERKQLDVEKRKGKDNGGSSGVSEVGVVMSEGRDVGVEGSGAMPRVYSRASEGIVDE